MVIGHPFCPQIQQSRMASETVETPVDVAPAAATPAKAPSRNQKCLDEWCAKGNKLPECINIGCSRPVAIRHWNDGVLPSLKTECAPCSTARKKGKVLPGIAFVKKHYCENSDARLGFLCPMDPARYAEFPSDCYEMDHVNGKHADNRPENIMTLCALCHSRKGKLSGDFNGSKSSSLRQGGGGGGGDA